MAQEKLMTLEELSEWERELEDQLAITRSRKRALEREDENLEALAEDFIVPVGAVPKGEVSGYSIDYHFDHGGQRTERTENLPFTRRSEAILNFWKNPPFSRLSRRVEIVNVTPIY